MTVTLSRASWTVGAFGGTFALKLGSTLVLSRLLAPQVFGVLVIVNTVRVGVELLSDIGIEQNIVRHKDGLTPRFFNTAWTLQMLRGLLLASIFAALSPIIGSFYELPVHVFLLMSLVPLLNSMHSTSIFALVKQLEVRKRNLFELGAEATTTVVTVTFALASPTIESIVSATLVSVATRSALSYLLPRPGHRFVLDRSVVREIFGFGKWIMVSSLLMYASTMMDRIILGRLAPLGVFGIYGLARTISDLPPNLAQRVSYQLLFPTLSERKASDERIEHSAVRRARARFLPVGVVVMATGIAFSDVAVHVLFDVRYQAAGAVLSLLFIASAVAALTSVNEALLLGSGRPAFIGAGNGARVVVLLVGLPIGYLSAGIVGAIFSIIVAEGARYLLVLVGQHRLELAFPDQDILAMLGCAALVGALVLVRIGLGAGTPWSGMIV